MNENVIEEAYVKWVQAMEPTYSNTPNYLLQTAAEYECLKKSAKKVKKAKGAAGIDRVPSSVAVLLVENNIEVFENKIKNNTYIPEKTRKAPIPKDNGELRILSIPTVEDRIVQQSLARVLIDIYDSTFSENSYAYRQGKSGQSAIEKAVEYANRGLDIVVDIDIKKFFDNVHKDILLHILSRKIRGTESLAMIRKILDSDYYKDNLQRRKKNGLYIDLNRGIPQGGPISGILANIYLNELDNFLKVKNIPFVRYADDCMFFTDNIEDAQIILNMVKSYLNHKLLLEVNEEKTQIVPVNEVDYLGMNFYKNENGEYSAHVSKKAMTKYKKRLQETIMTTPEPELSLKLAGRMRGKLNYLSNTHSTKQIYALDKFMLKLCCQRFQNPHLTFRELEEMNIPLHRKIWKEIRKS